MENFAASDSPIPVRSSLKIDYVWELKNLRKQFKAQGQQPRSSIAMKKAVIGGNRKSFLLSLQKIKNKSKDGLFKKLFSRVEHRELIEPELKLQAQAKANRKVTYRNLLITDFFRTSKRRQHQEVDFGILKHQTSLSRKALESKDDVDLEMMLYSTAAANTIESTQESTVNLTNTFDQSLSDLSLLQDSNLKCLERI